MLSQIFKNVYMRLDEKAVTMAQPQKMWSGIHAVPVQPCYLSVNSHVMSVMSVKKTINGHIPLLIWLVGWLVVSGAPTFVIWHHSLIQY